MSKVMIIVWRWQENHRGSWKVKGSKDIVYCLWEEEERQKQEVTVLENAKIHLQKGDEVFIFLHRSKHYSRQDVSRLLSALKKEDTYRVKCFLFGDNRDFIYADTQKEGLLGVGGIFGMVKGKKVIEDLEGKELKKEHFDKVWNYYSNEFKTKFYSLKEDLFLHFLPLYQQTKEVKAKELYGRLRENDLLRIRVKSMCEKDLRTEEKEKIEEDEKEHQVSYIFDDCTMNLQAIYTNNENEVYTNYEALKEKMGLLLNAPKSATIVPYLHLKDIRIDFENLLSSMPEATFY